MTGHPSATDRLREVFNPTPRGVVGLVDDLLAVCREQPLRLDFHDGHCRVGPPDAGAQDSIDVPLAKSVFRAVLARVAALCNERVPDSVTPYRGAGELSAPADPHAVFRVAFTNTPDEQRLTANYLGAVADRETVRP